MNPTAKTVKPIRLTTFTLADRLLATGQRLRADEPAVATTFALGYAAKWAQATTGKRRVVR